MSLPNRVDPWGSIVEARARGTFMGNRGGPLHDAHRRIVRAQSNRAWTICLTSFKGRRRQVMTPGNYTELFFLDEATALAAGHRPCFECRRPDATRFLTLWRETSDSAGGRVGDLDAALSDERRVPRSPEGTGKIRYPAVVGDLPDGAMIERDSGVWLVHDGSLSRWSHQRYVSRQPLDPDEKTMVLTPPATIAVLRAGYEAVLHPSA